MKLHSLVRGESAYWKWSKTCVVNQGESIAEYTTSVAKNVPDFMKVWHRTEVFTREKKNIMVETLSCTSLEETATDSAEVKLAEQKFWLFEKISINFL